MKDNPDARGMKPIEKNIIVSDRDGRRIGVTYPKRAKGLVKNGRAELISDHEIRLLITQFPAASINDTEATEMSKVINFDIRKFDLDVHSSQTNVGYRGFITSSHGNEEMWEIGDWGWNWTQLCTTVTGLEPDTDYVFRFAMTLGHNDDNREVSMVHIHYCGEDEQQAWNDRYTYCIGMSRFKPVISKRALEEDTMLRVFELPFHTGGHTDFRIIIVSQHAVSRFFKAQNNEAYADMEDLSYAQWREQRTETLEAQRIKRNQMLGFGSGRNGGGNEAYDSSEEMIESAIEDFRAEIDDFRAEIDDLRDALIGLKDALQSGGTPD